jgi:hypothetical protein
MGFDVDGINTAAPHHSQIFYAGLPQAGAEPRHFFYATSAGCASVFLPSRLWVLRASTIKIASGSQGIVKAASISCLERDETSS